MRGSGRAAAGRRICGQDMPSALSVQRPRRVLRAREQRRGVRVHAHAEDDRVEGHQGGASRRRGMRFAASRVADRRVSD